MQLRATIDSFRLHCNDLDQVRLVVLYKAGTPFYQRQYDRLAQEFQNITFIREEKFKPQLLDIVTDSDAILFLVDDNIFVRHFTISEICTALDLHPQAVGFSLRLGKNTTYCYAKNIPQKLPVFRTIGNGGLIFDWTSEQCDFGYPLEVSSSIYRKDDIIELLLKVPFTNPNTLEDALASNAHLYRQLRSRLLCFEKSVTFCAPVNMVQNVWQNRAGKNINYSAEQLAEKFEHGYIVDIKRYNGFVPQACHQEVELYFVKPHEERSLEHENIMSVSLYSRLNNTTPSFSVVMANYNNARYLTEAIESVINQTFENWELVIVDDGSTDHSVEIIKGYLNDKRIRLIRHQHNRGYTSSLKTALASIRSDYFGILDSDDCLTEDALEVMVHAHIKYPDCGLIYSQFMFCNDQMDPLKKGFCEEIAAGSNAMDKHVVSHFKTFKLWDYLKTDGYDESILYAEDIDIVYKMEEVAKLKFINQVLYLYRELPESLSHSRSKINVSIMSRVKARINALKRRCRARASAEGEDFNGLFKQAVQKARIDFEDVQQYFELLGQLYRRGVLNEIKLPTEFIDKNTDDILLWIAANVSIDFMKLFSILKPASARTTQPFITIEMAAYNTARYIKQAIDSILAQSYENYELVIVDDGSADETRRIVELYTDKRIRYIYQPHKNCARARNRIIAEARGEYLLCVDSDDYLAPDYLEQMVSWAKENPDAEYLYPSHLTLVDACGNLLTEQWRYEEFSSNEALVHFLFDQAYGPIPNPGSLKKKALFEKVGGYDESLDSVEDFAFLCKNALRLKFKKADICSSYFYRKVPGSSSHRYRARNRIIAQTLNEMVMLYKPEILCPEIAHTEFPKTKQRLFLQYIIGVFEKHANSDMVKYSEFFTEYAAVYKQKLLNIAGAETAGGQGLDLSGQMTFLGCFEQGVKWLKESDPERALVFFNHAYEMDPRTPDINHARAVALMQLKRFEEALAACDAELVVQPDHKGAIRLKEILSKRIKCRSNR